MKRKQQTDNNESSTDIYADADSLLERMDSTDSSTGRQPGRRIHRLTREDVRAFYTRPVVSRDEIDRVRPFVEAQLDKALSLIESLGGDVFRQHEETRRKQERDRIEQEKKEEQANLQALVVQGDPRQYQKALLAMARRENVIVHLGTGMGKTMIALLLIQEHLDGKQIVFLVPSVALVLQQAAFLQANLTQSVSIGKAYNNVVHSEVERRHLADCRIVVATHGAFLELLLHFGDLFTLDKVDLLILDECHHCTGNSPYTSIMNQFYHGLPALQRPRILGLTASPLINVKPSNCHEQSLTQQLEALEKILDSRVVSLGTSNGLAGEHWQVPNDAIEHVVAYSSSNNMPLTLTHRFVEGIHGFRSRSLSQMEHLYTEVGPYCTSLYVREWLTEIKRNNFEQESEEDFQIFTDYLSKFVSYCDSLSSMDKRYGGRSHKLLRLESLIDDELTKMKSMVGLVFVERRITATALNAYFHHRRSQRENEPEVYQSAKSILDNGVRRSAVADEDEDNEYAKRTEFAVDDNQFDDAEDEAVSSSSSSELPVDESGSGGSAGGGQFDDAEDDPYVQYFDQQNQQQQQQHKQRAQRTDGDVVMGSDADYQEDCQPVLIKSEALFRSMKNMFRITNEKKKLSEDEEKELRLEWLHQEASIRNVLDKLRQGDLNVLIATAIVEEGIDVQACSFVVAFDSIRSLKAYIQMKGRARQKDARFYVFQDANPLGEHILLSQYQEVEAAVQSFLREREQVMEAKPAAEHVINMQYTGSSRSTELYAAQCGIYEALNGTVTLRSAKSLLYRFVGCQPMDDTVRSTKAALYAYLPVYDDFNHRLILPPFLTHPPGIRIVSLPEVYRDRSKKDRHNILSIIACVRLHKNGLLNNRLLPLTQEDFDNLRLSALSPPKTVSLRVPTARFCRIDEDAKTTEKKTVRRILQEGDGLEMLKKRLGCECLDLAIVVDAETESAILSCDYSPYKHYHKQLGYWTCKLGDRYDVALSKEQCALLSVFFVVIFNARWKRRTKSGEFVLRSSDWSYAIPDYRIGCIDSSGQFAWDLMTQVIAESKRTEEERIAAVQSYNSIVELVSPRLWTPLYDKTNRYLVFGPSGETCATSFPPTSHEDVYTYKDYYDKVKKMSVSAEARLYKAQRLWDQPIAHSATDDARAKASTDGGDAVGSTVFTQSATAIVDVPELRMPQDLCMESILANPCVALFITILPQYLYFLESYMVAESFAKHCLVHFPKLGQCLRKIDLGEIVTSLSAASCNNGRSYDKLEWLGDAVLKIAMSESILNSKSLGNWSNNLHEGDLSSMRSSMGCNKTLRSLCKHIGFDKFILTKTLARGRWAPASLELAGGASIDDVKTTSKVYADVIEAVLGLVYIRWGYSVILSITDELSLTMERVNREPSVRGMTKPQSEMVDAAIAFTGETSLCDYGLVQEAFTHPTCIDSNCSSYQRLEWLGDAVICLASREWIYKTLYDCQVGEMVQLESTLTSNESLAYLSLKSGLYRFLRPRDQMWPARVDEYSRSVRDGGKGLWGTEPPKSLADIVESVIGAVHSSCGFAAGQKAAAFVLKPIMDLLQESVDIRKQILFHPRDAVADISSPLVKVDKSKGGVVALESADSSVWLDQQCVNVIEQGDKHTVSLDFLDVRILTVADHSSAAALNQACSLLVSILNENDKLMQRVSLARTIAHKNSIVRNKERGLEV
jgi:ERCC4-related helicase/dsRNA-specific ribonuclease